jgi:hypothetical protein
MPVHYTLTDPQGKHVFSQDKIFIHRGDYYVTIPPNGPGIYRMDVDALTWYGWSIPAVPMVLAGQHTRDGSTFALQMSCPRHWFFAVPKGTERFSVAANVLDPAHALALEVHAPDRLIAPAYIRGGKPQLLDIDVPAGLDGKIWFLRLEVGSTTRFITDDPANPHQTRIDADITLTGVPGYLAPTWEQWFDPLKKDLPK